jgi:hypothetical protein
MFKEINRKGPARRMHGYRLLWFSLRNDPRFQKLAGSEPPKETLHRQQSKNWT